MRCPAISRMTFLNTLVKLRGHLTGESYFLGLTKIFSLSQECESLRGATLLLHHQMEYTCTCMCTHTESCVVQIICPVSICSKTAHSMTRQTSAAWPNKTALRDKLYSATSQPWCILAVFVGSPSDKWTKKKSSNVNLFPGINPLPCWQTPNPPPPHPTPQILTQGNPLHYLTLSVSSFKPSLKPLLFKNVFFSPIAKIYDFVCVCVCVCVHACVRACVRVCMHVVCIESWKHVHLKKVQVLRACGG